MNIFIIKLKLFDGSVRKSEQLVEEKEREQSKEFEEHENKTEGEVDFHD